MAGLATSVRRACAGAACRRARRSTPALVAYVAVLLRPGRARSRSTASGFPTVIGDGSDAHLAAGTAEFLRHAHPLATDTSLPVDEVPVPWRSKQPIYYSLAAVGELSGLETWEALAPLNAFLLALATIGLFLLARGLLGAGVAAAAGRRWRAPASTAWSCTPVMHPYFNQTWGYFTLPFALVLGWWARRAPRPPGRRAARAVPGGGGVRLPAGAARAGARAGRVLVGRAPRRRSSVASRSRRSIPGACTAAGARCCGSSRWGCRWRCRSSACSRSSAPASTSRSTRRTRCASGRGTCPTSSRSTSSSPSASRPAGGWRWR